MELDSNVIIVMPRRPEPVFRSEEDIRNFLGQAGGRLETLALDLTLAATQLHKSMQHIPDGKLGVVSRVKARLVAAHLHACAAAVNASAGYVGGCWASYLKRYAKERGVAR
jgi:hypothetical protein